MVWIYFGTIYSVSLIYMCILMPIPHYPDYWGFKLYVLESGSENPPTLFFSFKNKNAQNGTSYDPTPLYPAHFN